MPTSDSELQKKRDHVEKLRERLAAEEAKRTTREAEMVNDVTAAQLDAEAAQLEAALERAKAANKVSAVREGASGPIVNAQEQMEQAVAQQKAQQELNADKENN